MTYPGAEPRRRFFVRSLRLWIGVVVLSKIIPHLMLALRLSNGSSTSQWMCSLKRRALGISAKAATNQRIAKVSLEQPQPVNYPHSTKPQYGGPRDNQTTTTNRKFSMPVIFFPSPFPLQIAQAPRSCDPLLHGSCAVIAAASRRMGSLERKHVLGKMDPSLISTPSVLRLGAVSFCDLHSTQSFSTLWKARYLLSGIPSATKLRYHGRNNLPPRRRVCRVIVTL